MNEVYKMCLTNINSYMKTLTQEEKAQGTNLTAFEMTGTIAIAFCKDQNTVMNDYLKLSQGL